eukprot:961200_1
MMAAKAWSYNVMWSAQTTRKKFLFKAFGFPNINGFWEDGTASFRGYEPILLRSHAEYLRITGNKGKAIQMQWPTNNNLHELKIYVMQGHDGHQILIECHHNIHGLKCRISMTKGFTVDELTDIFQQMHIHLPKDILYLIHAYQDDIFNLCNRKQITFTSDTKVQWITEDQNVILTCMNLSVGLVNVQCHASLHTFERLYCTFGMRLKDKIAHTGSIISFPGFCVDFRVRAHYKYDVKHVKGGGWIRLNAPALFNVDIILNVDTKSCKYGAMVNTLSLTVIEGVGCHPNKKYQELEKKLSKSNNMIDKWIFVVAKYDQKLVCQCVPWKFHQVSMTQFKIAENFQGQIRNLKRVGVLFLYPL